MKYTLSVGAFIKKVGKMVRFTFLILFIVSHFIYLKLLAHHPFLLKGGDVLITA